ncbi:MAG: cytochrome c oxidase assembly protein [Chloroflexota bacterium]
MWNFEPTVILGLALLCVTYALCVDYWRPRFADSAPVPRGQVVCFALAMLTLVIALLSPIDVLADRYLLTMHMVQHLLLTLVMPPLLLLSLPVWLVRPILRVPFALPALRWLTAPLVAYVLFNGVFAGWHVPALYEATLQSEPIHVLEHLMFMATALLAWWPIASPLPALRRVAFPLQVLYLFLQSVIPTVLGGLITFSDSVWYPTYLNAPRVWDLSALEDQQWAGLTMWIPGALIYLTALTVVFFVWFEGQEKVGEIR